MKKLVFLIISLTIITSTVIAYTVKIKVNGIEGETTGETGNTIQLIPKIEIEGWEVKRGNISINNNEFTMPEEDVEIEAILGYEVLYEENEGEWVPEAQKKLSNEDLILTSSLPVREGYNFTNWNTKADGTDDWVNLGIRNYTNPTIEAVVEFNTIPTSTKEIVSNINSAGYDLCVISGGRTLFQ